MAMKKRKLLILILCLILFIIVIGILILYNINLIDLKKAEIPLNDISRINIQRDTEYEIDNNGGIISFGMYTIKASVLFIHREIHPFRLPDNNSGFPVSSKLKGFSLISPIISFIL